MTNNRRDFIINVASACTALPFISIQSEGNKALQSARYPVRLFSKPIDSYDFNIMCECIAGAGIGGFDMTVRPGGKIEPDKVEKELPKYVREAKKYGLAFDMMVTGILSAKDPFTERILKTASENGVKYYRLGWCDYDLKSGIWESIQKFHRELEELTKLNIKYRIHGGYQNHAGSKIGSPVWDLYEVLKDFPQEYTGCQYDVRHAMVEGANTWILGMRVISEYIRSLAIKDFTWKTVKGKPQAVTVPLGEGMVNWDQYFKILRELDISGPLSLHVEYPLLEDGEEKLPVKDQQEIIIRKLKKDMEFLNSYLKKYQLG